MFRISTKSMMCTPRFPPPVCPSNFNEALASLNSEIHLQFTEFSSPYADIGTFGGSYSSTGDPISRNEVSTDYQVFDGIDDSIFRTSDETVSDDPLEILVNGSAFSMVIPFHVNTIPTEGVNIAGTTMEKDSSVRGYSVAVTSTSIKVYSGSTVAAAGIYHYAEGTGVSITTGVDHLLVIDMTPAAGAQTISMTLDGVALTMAHYSRDTSTILPPPVPRADIQRPSFNGATRDWRFGRGEAIGLAGQEFPDDYVDGQSGSFSMIKRALSDSEMDLILHSHQGLCPVPLKVS